MWLYMGCMLIAAVREMSCVGVVWKQAMKLAVPVTDISLCLPRHTTSAFLLTCDELPTWRSRIPCWFTFGKCFVVSRILFLCVKDVIEVNESIDTVSAKPTWSLGLSFQQNMVKSEDILELQYVYEKVQFKLAFKLRYSTLQTSYPASSSDKPVLIDVNHSQLSISSANAIFLQCWA